jgi:hypothetical protein
MAMMCADARTTVDDIRADEAGEASRSPHRFVGVRVERLRRRALRCSQRAMQAIRLAIPLALALAACITDDDPTGTDEPGGTIPGPAPVYCPLPIGSCRVVYAQGTYCSDVAIAPEEASAAELDCKSSYRNSTWSQSRCSTTGTVGGCRFEAAGACSTLWSFPPLTREQAKQSCVDGTFIPPP